MMNEHKRGGMRSERGMALIMVLLLLAVISSLATGLTMNGQVEVAMASNEATYAGARAAAEAGMNRAIAAILNNTTDDLLATFQETGDASFLLTEAGPYTIGPNLEYSYVIEIFDDDDPVLYPTALTADQLDQMNEDGDPEVNLNDRLILRVTGFGPNGTRVSVGRILETVGTTNTSTTETTVITNPALLVNGDLSITGNIDIVGERGNIHTNGNMSLAGGAYNISGDAHAAGTFTPGNGTIGGVAGGGYPSVNVPDINANDYFELATHILHADGTMTTVFGAPACTIANCGWSFSGGSWDLAGNTADAGTFFVEGSATISGNPNGGGPPNNRSPLPLSVIATGSISVTGTPILGPNNPNHPIQFVTNGDLLIAGNADIDRTLVEGQSLVREQLSISGNPDLRGQIIVQDVTDCNPCSSLVTANSVTGNMTIIYDGSFGDMETVITETEILPTSWVNNVAGWMEGM
jgi:type II secretory pathway pseudopilin PulG